MNYIDYIFERKDLSLVQKSEITRMYVKSMKELFDQELKDSQISLQKPVQKAHCRKCGERILGDEDSLCGYCSGESYGHR